MAKVWGSIILVTLIWGYTWVTMKIGLEYIPPFLFAALRFLIGAVPLLLLQLALKKPLLPARRDWIPIGTMSVLMSLGYSGLLMYGMRFVNSGQTSVLVYTMPIFVTVLAHFFLKEKLTATKGIGLAFGFAGLLFILGPQLHRFAFDQAFMGQILILLSALSWGCANIFSKLKFSNYDIMKMTCWQLLLGGVMLLVISAAAEPWSNVQWTLPSVSSLLFNGIFSTSVTFVAWFWVLGRIEASTASMTLMTVPILGLFFGWLQLHEQLTANIAAGALLICLGIFFGARKRAAKQVPAQGRL
ncbi:DMT family transporter [Paenibacillus beijingensis]|uniref:EamA domain-containing protein n=1 Tax=Paenibacillus beijingensis TaxID=1126833 RepID=A0A0D5NLV4_9BACL|nr:DMT family transporter [Paenibacillus beijingensis]AJY76309.1 hypothetical protein VN24_19235 [Paenibacillus beijingensis]